MEIRRDQFGRPLPTGVCWCGCDVQVDVGKFFLPGHNRKAIDYIIYEFYDDSTVEFVARHLERGGGLNEYPATPS